MGGTRALELGPAEFGWVARGFGAGGPWSLDGWHAAQELGGSRGGGRSLDGRHAAQDLVGAPRSLDGWHAAQELGVRGVWMDLARVAQDFGPAVLDGGKHTYRHTCLFRTK